MRFPLIPLLAFCALMSCAPVEMYYQPGVSVAKLVDDELTCDVSALRDAPVTKVRQQAAPVFIPPRRYCDSNGHCWTEGGYWEPGMVYTVDVNRNLRARLAQNCMAKRGYTQVSLPQCDPGVSAPGPTQVLPRLTESTCALRNRDGSLSIVQTAP